MKGILSSATVACVVAVIFVAGFSAGQAHRTAQPQLPAHAPVPTQPIPARPLRLGVIGDSLTLPGSGAWADSWLRMLIDSQRVSCGDERPDPTTCGGRSWRYAWAASGATTATAFARGWVADAAHALRSGELDAVVVMIGIDDLALFQGDFLIGKPPSAAQWDEACSRIEANWLRIAHELQVGRGLVVFSELPDPTGIPVVSALLRGDAALRARLQGAVQRLNSFLTDLTVAQNLPLFDFVRRQRELAIDPAAQDYPGIALQPLGWGRGVDSGFASDGIHLGPIPTGVLAAGIVELLNGYRAGIPPLPRSEVAGLAQSFTASDQRRATN